MGALFGLIILAHSWYPMECCSEQDCRPVPCEELAESSKGAVIWSNKTLGEKLFEKSRVHPSQDAQCHICLHGVTDIPICAFIQQGV